MSLQRFSNAFARGAAPSSFDQDPLITGVIKAQATGKVNGFDIEVVINEEIRYARPCFTLGSRMSVPDEDWLNKYKDQIFIWLTFEQGQLAAPVWVGIGILDNENLDWPDFPQSDIYRTVNFQETVSDKNKTYSLEMLDTQQSMVLNEEGKEDKFKNRSVTISDADTLTAENDINVTSTSGNISNDANQNITLSAGNKILLGSTQAAIPALLGTEVNATLVSVLNLINDMTTQMVTFANSLAAATATAPLTPISGVATSFSAQVGQNAAKITEINSKLQKHLSNKVFIDK